MLAQNNVLSSQEKNDVICRNELDLIFNGNFRSSGYEECRNMQFYKITGITNFWESEKNLKIHSLVGDILNSYIRHGVPFSYVIIGDEKGINIYVGALKILAPTIMSSYESVYPGIDTHEVSENPLFTCPREFGGFFTGIPTLKSSVEEKNYQIENICRGMMGRKFTYMILASGISSIAVSFAHKKILNEMDQVFSFIHKSVSGGAQGNISIEQQDFHSQNYFDNLDFLEKGIKNGLSRGMWRVNGYYASDNQQDAMKLGNIIKASFSGEDSKPEPFRVLEYNHIKDVIENVYFMSDVVDNCDIHPLGHWHIDQINKDINMYIYKYQTIMNSDQMSVLCQLPIKEFPGYYIDDYVEFDVANRTVDKPSETIAIGDICVAGRENKYLTQNKYYIDKNDLTRHALIIGITGGGKTNTSKYLLNCLWNTSQQKRTPFMVIESAKKEYWELKNMKGFEDVLVFTLGLESQQNSVKYRINPFETMPEISLQTHIDYLLATFKAAFELYPPMPYVLESAVYEIYEDRGWDIVENRNIFGFTQYPTLTDLYNKIDILVDRLGYHQEVQSNVKAALQSRIYSLMIGGKGAMLNTSLSTPIEKLLSKPVVMELEDLGDDETKSFVIGLLMVQLYEYRKSQISNSHQLNHVLLIEEAHRLLRNVSEGSEGSNTRAKSVEFFCNMLAEIRSYGQGIIIADQIPTKIAADSIKNTNLKIVHRTVAAEDRETIGKAMNMSIEQINYLSSLKRGYAAVYAEGDNKPKCVKLPLIIPYYQKSRKKVIAEVKKSVIFQELKQNYKYHIGCLYCENQCNHRDDIINYVEQNIHVDKLLKIWGNYLNEPRVLQQFIDSQLKKKMKTDNIFVCICFLGYLFSFQRNLKDSQKQQIIADYLRYIKKQEEREYGRKSNTTG